MEITIVGDVMREYVHDERYYLLVRDVQGKSARFESEKYSKL
jgi:hypothetical protein